MDNPSYIFWTAANREEARTISKSLLTEKLIACASIMPVLSLFIWKGKLEEAEEAKVILKTKSENFEEIKAFILKHGSYEVPEIVLIKWDDAHKPYLDWVNSL